MKTRGFTLIELLAVIAILGLLMVLIVPKVTQTLSDAEKNTNMTSAQNLVKAAELKVSNNEMTGNPEDIKINYKTGENTNKLDYSGEKPTSGELRIKSNGQIAMAVKFGDYCYIKGYDSSDIRVIPYVESNCEGKAEVFTNYAMPDLATTGDGLYNAQGEPGRYVYRGANPNNYINLKEDGTNNTLYRIISYEADGTIKVIRDSSIGDKKWDNSTDRNTESNTYCTVPNGCNVWATQGTTFYNGATLNGLNQDFYYRYFPNNLSNSLQNSTNSGTVTENATLNMYLNHTGEYDNYWQPAQVLDKYIAEHSFDVGGIYYDMDYPASNAKSLLQEKTEQNVYTWHGKIGIMNITEYVEASLNPACTNVYSNYYYNSNYYSNNTQSIVEYDNWPCSNRMYNWMPKESTEWVLTPNSSGRAGVWIISNSGYFDHYSPYSIIDVRPVFYLKSSTRFGGLGTSSEPYYIIES